MDIPLHWLQARTKAGRDEIERRSSNQREAVKEIRICRLYTSDAAVDMQCVELGGPLTFNKQIIVMTVS